MTSIASIKKCLVQYINSEAPQGHLLVVYVFGSFARNQERVKSDIDLAFLVDQASYRKDPFEATVPVHMIAGKMGMQSGAWVRQSRRRSHLRQSQATP
jgi:hypothetical protein